MTVKELYDLFKEFKENEFGHMRKKVDCLYRKIDGIYRWIIGIFISIILLLIGAIINLAMK